MEPWRQHTLDIYGVELFAVSRQAGWRELRKTVTFISKKPTSAGLTEFAVWHPREGKAKGIPRGHLVLWVDAKRHHDLVTLVDTCAHEAYHGANRILGWVGVDDGEATAYLTGWLTGWLLDFVNAGGD